MTKGAGVITSFVVDPFTIIMSSELTFIQQFFREILLAPGSNHLHVR